MGIAQPRPLTGAGSPPFPSDGTAPVRTLSGMRLEAIEVLADRTDESRCDEGFLRIARLLVRNRYDDGSFSDPYPCDVMTRRGSDAVVAVLYEIDSDGRVQVLLRESPRIPVYLRKDRSFVHPDAREYLTIHEVVAGMVEQGDGPGLPGLRRRAVAEAREEAGLELEPDAFDQLGGETFASPGTTDEKLYFVAGGVSLEARPDGSGASGDGSVMEEWCKLHRFELGAALSACRKGAIPDMKTELALLRLADHLGWIPQLGCFVHELPEELRATYDSLGVERAEP